MPSPSDELSAWRTSVDARLVAYKAAKARARSEQTDADTLHARLRNLQEAQDLAQHVAQQVQSMAHKQIANIVTSCLAIFDEPYTFEIEFARARGKTEARLWFEKDGQKHNPMTMSGGGCVDVTAFALRVAALCLSQPPLRRCLVLDEPFRFVSPQYRPRIRLLLDTLAEDMGIQFIMVTHDDALRTGKVVQID